MHYIHIANVLENIVYLCSDVFSLWAAITSSLTERCCLCVCEISSCSLLICSRNVVASLSNDWLMASTSLILLDNDLLDY